MTRLFHHNNSGSSKGVSKKERKKERKREIRTRVNATLFLNLSIQETPITTWHGV